MVPYWEIIEFFLITSKQSLKTESQCFILSKQENLNKVLYAIEPKKSYEILHDQDKPTNTLPSTIKHKEFYNQDFDKHSRSSTAIKKFKHHSSTISQNKNKIVQYPNSYN